MHPSSPARGFAGLRGQLRSNELRELFLWRGLQLPIQRLRRAIGLRPRTVLCRSWVVIAVPGVAAGRFLRIPDMILAAGNLLQAAPGHDAVGRLLGDRRVSAAALELIVLL